MRSIKEEWRAGVAAIWSIAAVLELLKGDLIFAAVAAVIAIVTWDSYRRNRRCRTERATEQRIETY